MDLEIDHQLRLARLRAREMSIRDAAAYDAPTHVGPFGLRPMLPADVLLLYASGNALFHRRILASTSLAHVFAALAILTGRPAPRALRWHLHRWRVGLRLLVVRLRPRAWLRLLAQLGDYQHETFLDWPGSSSSGSSARTAPPSPRGNFLSHWEHLIYRHYHWTAGDFARTPIRRLLIYRKYILADLAREEGRKVPPDTSLEERRLNNDYLLAVERGEAGGAAST